MKEKEMKASDLFVKNPIEDKKKELEIATEIEKEVSIPSNYIEVKLSSSGALGLPPVVHVRDYVYKEALIIAEIKEDNLAEGMINILNNIVYEDIDMSKAHIQDITEILLSIYGTWYSPVLEVFNYYVDESLEGEEKNAKENISVATIPINNIKTIPLEDGIKLPITFKYKNSSGVKEYQLILPRVGNDTIAQKFANKKNLKTEIKIAESIKAVKNDNYTEKQMEEYEKFITQRGRDLLRALQCQLIFSVDGKELKTFKEKLDALDTIPLRLWRSYNEIVKSKFQFGVQEKVKFNCSINHKEIERGFRFRPIHFLPLLDKEDDSGFEVSYG